MKPSTICLKLSGFLPLLAALLIATSCNQSASNGEVNEFELDSEDILAYERLPSADKESYEELRMSGSGELIYTNRLRGQPGGTVRKTISREDAHRFFRKFIEAGLKKAEGVDGTADPPYTRIVGQIDGETFIERYPGPAPEKYSTIFESIKGKYLR